MYFESFAAAISMDGHGVYVWSAFGLSVITFFVIALAPVRRKNRLLRQIAGEIRRESQGRTP